MEKLHINEKNNYLVTMARKDVKDKAFIMKLYDLDETAFELWKTARLNTNIIHENNPGKAEIGYKAYWDLQNYIKQNDMNDDVLSDLSAEFAWDRRLHNACKRFDKKYGKKNYQEFNGVLFDPADGWTMIYDDIILELDDDVAKDVVSKFEQEYGKYPNVKKACSVYYNGTYRTEPYDYSMA